MVTKRKRPVLRIIIAVLLSILLVSSIAIVWLSYNYKPILMKRIPAMVEKGSDSIYHISFSDISISISKRQIIITDIKVWADTNQVNTLRQQNRYSPNTVSFFSAPKAEALGIRWENILSGKSLDCANLIIHNPKWFMETKKHHPDLSYIEEEQHSALITRVSAGRVDIVNPDVTYHYIGNKNTYYCYLNGGTAQVYQWVVDRDVTKDTSVFLYGQHGSVTPASFRLHKDGREYDVKSPVIDFISTPASLTLKNVALKQFTDIDRQTGETMETFNLRFPSIEIANFNWKKLLNRDVFAASKITADNPYIDIHYVREHAPSDKNKVGTYPHQLIHEFIKTSIRVLQVNNGTLKYSEPDKTGKMVTFPFNGISGTIENITNIDSLIAENKNCVVKLEGKFMNKSKVATTFFLSLADPKGHFTLDGYVNNLKGEDISPQAAAFTFAKVTSFDLSHMEGHLEGDESYGKGEFAMRYDNLKLSLFKFDTDERKSKKGPFSFLADALILYPSNPMPGEPIRRAATSMARDPHKGFIANIWQNIYLGAQKTAVRSDKILALSGQLTDDKSPEVKEQPKKKGFLKRLFGKK
jgi:hypothetical protein